MYGRNPNYGYGRSMHLCPGCGYQVPFGYACTSCYMPWDPTTFLVAEVMEEVMEEIAEVEVFPENYYVETDDGYDYGNGGW